MAPPSAPPPLSLEALPEQRSLPASFVGRTHALVRVRAARSRAGDRPRLSAALVLDVSGSMQGEPLRQVARSAARIAEILEPQDRVAVVAFSHAARTVAPLTSTDAEGKRAIARAVESLKVEGNTNISAGLAHAALLLPPREEGERQALILLSDGCPNEGTTTEDGLGEEARRVKARGVGVSTLGYGSKHDEAVLIAVADGGGGRYAFVSDPELSQSSFARAVGAQLDVVAEDVELILAPGEGIEIARVLGSPRTSFGATGLRVSLPDLVVGDERNVVVELRLRSPRKPGSPLLSARLEARCGATALSAEALAETGEGEASPEPSSQAAIAIARADELRAEARASADRGAFAAAIESLGRAKAALEGAPGFVAGEADPLNDALDAIVDDIAVLEQKPDAERYAHYRKATVDFLDFAQGGVKARGGGGTAAQSPSAQALAQRAISGPLPPARLVVVSGPGAPATVLLDRERVVLGRGRMVADLVLPDANVSRQHALVEYANGAFWLVDMGSTNGVEVAGKRVSRFKLEPGTVFTVGDHQIRFDTP